MCQKHRSGFTVVEILIVVTVVSVLATILFSVFARVREKSRQTACQSNLKQIALGIQQYVQDNDSHYPSVRNWAEAVLPYIGNKQVLRCPSELVPVRDDLSSFSFYNFHNRWFNTVTYTEKSVVYSGVNDSVIPDPSTTSLLSDGASGHQQKIVVPKGCTDFEEIISLPEVHFNGRNYLFGDGHAKWLNTDTYVKLECSAS
ncbi:hypothetical protein B1R32_11468 [Abditibacterium utsteinense]|uniref:DUF1559 domain-containing protein n=2 Tax=Abditibacterium utsteinense TaxID=1960156 RepID=A0A2S8SR02_9BACT|nr:hypothetical protein B1R32_11468 [Abditibacterium utsteinense]